MKSEDSKRIIKQISQEEGVPEWAVTLIVNSQFHAAHKIISSATPDDISTFKGVKINALGVFKVNPKAFKRFKGRKAYEEEKRVRYDSKRKQY